MTILFEILDLSREYKYKNTALMPIVNIKLLETP